MTQTTAMKIAQRQDKIRMWLNQERDFLPMTSKIDTVGKYAAYRWYRFGQLALFRNGQLLGNDEQWATIEKEMNDWPMSLWLSILDQDATIREAKEVYNSMTLGRITVTQHTEEGTFRPFQLVKLGWVTRNIRSATQLQIWEWLGPIGGEYPPRPVSNGE